MEEAERKRKEAEEEEARAQVRGQNDRLLADDILKCIFLNEIAWIFIKISL